MYLVFTYTDTKFSDEKWLCPCLGQKSERNKNKCQKMEEKTQVTVYLCFILGPSLAFLIENKDDRFLPKRLHMSTKIYGVACKIVFFIYSEFCYCSHCPDIVRTSASD